MHLTARFLIGLLALSSLATGSRAAEPLHWQPTMQQVQALEARLRLPRGADPLSSYARYYTGDIVAGHRVIRGYFLSGEPAGIFLKPSDLIVADGGCSVVEVAFDVDTKQVDVGCNGVA